jgi:secreted PhoX family phosphatase
MPDTYHRRSFLEFLGKAAIATAMGPHMPGWRAKSSMPRISGLKPSDADELLLAKGLSYDVLIKWGDKISRTDTFGFNNDFTALIPGPVKDDALLWVNHEYVDPLFVSRWDWKTPKTLDQVHLEQYAVGGSILQLRRDAGGWHFVESSPLNRRITALTEIPFRWYESIENSNTAIGTLANCSGGVTPWGTILTCEENYDMFYGERKRLTREIVTPDAYLGWRAHYPYPPEHYGWVVEVNPKTGTAQKLIALGRCSHECATIFELPDGRVVVYTGDDANDQCLYKFVSDKPGSLVDGTLYVANVLLGRWMSLRYEDSEVLQKMFRSQTDVLINLREAAKYVGGSPLDRPEDIEIDPVTGHVFISLTNNSNRNNPYGSILKIAEQGNDYAGMNFEASTFLAGGEATGFACPDNMAFDQSGNLWFASDISTAYLNRSPYVAFRNNGLFVVPRVGKQAGEVIQVASAPVGAELTGPWFSPDGKTLFLSVQHPGENSPALDQLTSHWPEGGESLPKPSVVMIQGELLEGLTGV